MDQFLGRPIRYWIELQARFDASHARPIIAADLIQEISELRGKLSFYESRIKEINVCMGRLDKPAL